MGKLLLGIVVGFGVAMYFPEARRVVLEKSEPVLNRIFVRSAEHEIEEIVAGLRQMESVEGRLPAPREWAAWLDARYRGDRVRDSWGNLYGFEVTDDSFAVVSYGPDRELGTRDDIREVQARSRPAK